MAERRLDTVVDSLLAIQGAWDLDSSGFNPSQEDALRRHIGDYTLFMTGIFRDHVERLAVTSYYEHEGRRAYRFVSETARDGRPTPTPPLFRRLSDRFEQYAGALTYARKVYFRADAVPTARLARRSLPPRVRRRMMATPASDAEAACLDALERALGGETPPDLGPCPATVLDGALRELVRRHGADAAPLLARSPTPGPIKEQLRKVAKLAIYRLEQAGISAARAGGRARP